MKTSSTCDRVGSLAGQVAMVTGGAHGIGRAIAARFQKAGARVCILDCDRITGQAVAEELTTCNPDLPATFVFADLEKPGEIQSAAEEVQRLYTELDVLVNNAGVELDKPFPEMTAEVWDRIIAINLRAPFLLTQAVLPLFSARGGAVINISSIHSTHAFPDSTTYACSKAGLIALTRNLALELAPRRIRVNAICPGYIDTRLWEEYIRSAPDSPDLADRTTAFHPIGRRGVPDDVAEAARFFAANTSSFVTGTHLVVDGGLTIRTHY
jgi:NAD(P)-dependent dehydrogenase (short-subunit alcohol dehydrogenase family)